MPKQLKKNGMQGRLIVSDNALRSVIEGYTREAGVRGLERKLGEICRKAARELLKEDKSCIRVNDREPRKISRQAQIPFAESKSDGRNRNCARPGMDECGR